jgi:hypothetical protein
MSPSLTCNSGKIGSQTIKTDGWQSYNVAGKLGYTDKIELILGRKAHNVLKWVHILTSNAKAFVTMG